jgi:signal transduction histidine kinase
MRRRLPAGLRWRLLLALLATSAVTLGVAALVVLPPMQDRLRESSEESLETQVAAIHPEFQAVFERLDASDEPVSDFDYESQLGELAAELNSQSNARVLVLDDDGQGSVEGEQFLYDSELFADFPRRALRNGLRVLRLGGTQIEREGDSVVVAMPIFSAGTDPTAVLIADRELTEAAALLDEVRNRFLIAAVVGLAVATLLAIGLSSTLLRRLGRLRAVALRIMREGPDAPTPRDERRDEVGDLARALTRMQEELRRQEAARRAFVSTASHELRTPLTMLQGTMELLEEDIRTGRLDEDDALRQVSIARTELDRLSALAGELLDLSRLDAAVPLRSEPVELGEIVRAVVAEFELRARERATSIVATLPDAPCWGRGDPDAVARVVRILLDNALRYGPPGAPVRVEAHVRGIFAAITVADEGGGIPEDEREHIFERFHRGAAAGSSGGFGLGLAIGRELARRMGGELEVVGDGSDGTRFALTLHAAHAPAEPPRGDRDRVSA